MGSSGYSEGSIAILVLRLTSIVCKNLDAWLWVTLSPCKRLSVPELITRARRLIKALRVGTGMWVAVVARNPDVPGRYHVHLLMKTPESIDDVERIAKRRDIAGGGVRAAEVIPAEAYHSTYLLRHLREDTSFLDASPRLLSRMN